MVRSLILAIDQGGQSSRVAVYTTSGERLHCFSEPCLTTHQSASSVDYIEQDPHEILSGIVRGLESVENTLGDAVKDICAIGFAGQGSSLLCWDTETGEALSPVLSWQDIRGERYLKNIPITHSQTQNITGLRVSPHYGASKIKWCLDNNLKAMAAHKNNSLAIGPIVSYIFWKLCGVNVVDPGHAQRTLLWNLQKNNWDEFLLKLFGIPYSVLPKCKYHNSHFGDLVLHGHTIPFSSSARDQGASLFACGLPDKNAFYINVGTGAFIQRVSEDLSLPDGLLVSPLWIPEKKLATNDLIEVSSPTCYASELINPCDEYLLSNNKLPSGKQSQSLIPLYAWEATVNGAASALSFIEQESGLSITPEQIKKSLLLKPERDCYFLNALGGLGAPYWRTNLQSCFSANLSSEEKILAWLESIIFQISVNVKLMNKLGEVQKIYISGGISKADGICQKLADLLDIPVHRSENTDATLQGTAYMAAGFPFTWNCNLNEDIFMPQANSALQKTFNRWQESMAHWLSV